MTTSVSSKGYYLLRVRLTPREKAKLQRLARNQGRTMSGVIHQYLARCPGAAPEQVITLDAGSRE